MKNIHKSTEIVVQMFAEVLEKVSQEVKEDNKWFILFSAKYIVGVKKDLTSEKLYEKIKNPETKEVVMNAIGIIREEGERKMAIKTAKVLKEQGIDYYVITLSTGLTKEEIDQL